MVSILAVDCWGSSARSAARAKTTSPVQAPLEFLSEGCNNSKSGRGVIFQPRLSREYATKQAEITPSLVGIGVCVMNSKGRYHAHALVASLTGFTATVKVCTTWYNRRLELGVFACRETFVYAYLAVEAKRRLRQIEREKHYDMAFQKSGCEPFA